MFLKGWSHIVFRETIGEETLCSFIIFATGGIPIQIINRVVVIILDRVIFA